MMLSNSASSSENAVVSMDRSMNIILGNERQERSKVVHGSFMVFHGFWLVSMVC